MEPEYSIAVAKYDYTAEADNELTIRKNEKLTVLDDSQLWWMVQNERSHSGFVPSNYLTRKDSTKGKKNIIANLTSKVLKNTKRTSIDPTESDSQPVKLGKQGGNVLMVATAKYPYAPTRDDEIELNRGDQVMVLEMEHDGWCRGECNGKTGWFPFNYIQTDTSPEYVSPSDIMPGVDTPIICKVRTLYKFASQSHEELSFEKDSVLEIINKPKDDPDWWQARKSNGEIGLVPRNYVEEIVSSVTPGPVKPKHPVTSTVERKKSEHEFSNRDWYHGTLSRQLCESLLRNHAKEGEYLVRNSESKPGDYSLSMKVPDRIKHFKISFVNDKYVIGQRSFDSVDSLINHYIKAVIYTTDSGQKMHLEKPLSKTLSRNGVGYS
ncbi:cytoplasmic protein NCK2-like [Hydractinia symbiolongicarpus]|uniref:cytoplasmic protein NCK2-like n=1 Tax=Hydractinia symbiolongicarpus TaxID=13093 RepID=UPI00254FA6FD|nr:cytoplasmic protein NCK2-like [Hydractinia symbiolongicarpus]